jgi:hypothetical protein
MNGKQAECGCCGGVEKSTPVAIYNRPGLDSLRYRVGDYATFLESMLARLSNLCLGDEEPCAQGYGDYPLQKLTTRNPDDAAIALLHGWATVADVLSFYQERLANEGYLRTAGERRSILELARLVGYQLRPGVAASVYLAYGIDDKFPEEALIPKGSRSQSLPGPGEMPQAFETSEDLKARAAWNNLQPRQFRPQFIVLGEALTLATLYIEGTAAQLKNNDRLLLVFGDEPGQQVVRKVKAATVHFELERSDVELQETPALIVAAVFILRGVVARLDQLLAKAKPAEAEAERQTQRLLIAARLLLRRYLENFCLGNYPQLDKHYFDHERIYRALKPAAGMLRAGAAAFDAAGWRRIFQVSNVAEAVDLAQQNPAMLWLLKSLVAQTRLMLKSEALKAELICLSTYVLQQLQPTDPQEREDLQALIRWIPAFRPWLTLLWKSPEKVEGLPELQTQIRALLLDLSSFLQHRPLRFQLNALLEELIAGLDPENDTALDFLKQVQAWLAGFDSADSGVECEPLPAPTTSLSGLLMPLLKTPALSPLHSADLSRNLKRAFAGNADGVPQLVTAFRPQLKTTLYSAWAHAAVAIKAGAEPKLEVREQGLEVRRTDEGNDLPLQTVHLLGLIAPLFGANAQPKMAFFKNNDDDTRDSMPFVAGLDGDWQPGEAGDEQDDRLFLDNEYPSVSAGAPVLIHDFSVNNLTAITALSVALKPRTAYGISGKTTQIELLRPWWTLSSASLRKTSVGVPTATLSLAKQPWLEDVYGDFVETERLYDGLVSGQRLIVEGERSDVAGTGQVMGRELMMILAVEQVLDPARPGDKTHSKITFAKTDPAKPALAYRYKRQSLKIYGNVVKATHGETRNEVLGSGDGGKALQSFALKQPPLTFVSAANPAGVDSSLKVYVNQIEWHESPSLFSLSADQRGFIGKTDDDGNTRLVFGNGRQGARLPSGVENVRAEYRSGIGKAGNVQAAQISLLVSRPLGVKEVVNPLAATGGADKESRDQARRNAPLAVKALDRLVSVRDYQDFARTFGGVGKAYANELPDGRRQVVHVTIAGVDDIPIDAGSDLFINLYKALRDYGDPLQSVQLATRGLMLIVLSASVKILGDYQWPAVAAELRSRLLAAYGFERRELGQAVALSEIVGVMQAVPGVDYVDVDAFGGLPETLLTASEDVGAAVAEQVEAIALHQPPACLPVEASRYQKQPRGIRPAQLAYLSAEVPETLILNRIA